MTGILPYQSTTPILQPLRQNLHLSRPTRPRARRLPARSSNQLANLKQIRLQRIHPPGRLSVLGRRTYRYRVVFDDISNTEAVAGSGTKPEMTQSRVSAVRRRKDGGVVFVPAGVVENGGDGGWWCWSSTDTAGAVASAAAETSATSTTGISSIFI